MTLHGCFDDSEDEDEFMCAGKVPDAEVVSLKYFIADSEGGHDSLKMGTVLHMEAYKDVNFTLERFGKTPVPQGDQYKKATEFTIRAKGMVGDKETTVELRSNTDGQWCIFPEAATGEHVHVTKVWSDVPKAMLKMGDILGRYCGDAQAQCAKNLKKVIKEDNNTETCRECVERLALLGEDPKEGHCGSTQEQMEDMDKAGDHGNVGDLKDHVCKDGRDVEVMFGRCEGEIGFNYQATCGRCVEWALQEEADEGLLRVDIPKYCSTAASNATMVEEEAVKINATDREKAARAVGMLQTSRRGLAFSGNHRLKPVAFALHADGHVDAKARSGTLSKVGKVE